MTMHTTGHIGVSHYCLKAAVECIVRMNNIIMRILRREISRKRLKLDVGVGMSNVKVRNYDEIVAIDINPSYLYLRISCAKMF